MKQFELFNLSRREVQPQQRLATDCVVNSAYGEVTNHMKPEGARYWAVTQVKGLSPEIPVVSEAEAFHLAEGNSLISDRRRGDKNLMGSETTARYQKEKAGTRETRSIPRDNRVCTSKPMDGKLRQKMLRESEQFIVVRKQGNACGAKGLAVMDGGRRGHFLHTQKWAKEVNKTVFPLRSCSGESTDEVYFIDTLPHSGFSQGVLQGA